MPLWRIAVAGLILAGLAAGLLLALFDDAGTAAAAPASSVAVPPPSSPAPAPDMSSPEPTPPPSTTSVALPAVTTTPALPAAVEALHDALAAWGVFATTGRMRDLGDRFVVGGPQRRRLRTESAALRADRPGPPPYRVTADELSAVAGGETHVVLRAAVTWSRSGEAARVFVWDVEMRLVDDGWRVWTVAPARP